MLNSWKNRYVMQRDQDMIERGSRERLKVIAGNNTVWAERFGDIDALDLLELELWFWRFETETVHEVGNGRVNYHVVRYETLVEQPVARAKDVYEFCGLEWNESIEACIAKDAEGSGTIAEKWRSRLTHQEVSSINQIMAESPLRDWWDIG